LYAEIRWAILSGADRELDGLAQLFVHSRFAGGGAGEDCLSYYSIFSLIVVWRLLDGGIRWAILFR
jgi:hypothetical protein